MTNDKNGWQDVRWMDERALHQATLEGDPEAFSELIRRYDPVVRYRVWRVLGGLELVLGEPLDSHIADFWCTLLDDEMAILRQWNAERELFAAWLGALASRTASERLRQLLRKRAAAA